MRKIFTLMMACVFAFAMSATDIVFDSNPNGGTKGSNTTASGADEMTKDGVKIAVTSGAFGCTGDAAPYYSYRLGKNSTTTITSAQTITKVVFECNSATGSQYLADGFGEAVSVSADKLTATWTGSATEVSVTAPNHQVRVEKITVTVGGEAGVMAPQFSKNEGTYYAPINVEITCATSGATIKYTLNGGAEQTYSAPIALSTTTTLAAYAQKDGKTSTTTTATYTFAQATDVANIAAYKVVEDGTQVKFGCDVTVLAVNGKNMYVTDGTDYMLVFGTTGQTYKHGDVIPAGFTGKKTTYNGEPELSVYDTDNFQAAKANTPVEPELAQTVDINASYFGKYIYMPNVTISGIESGKQGFNIADGAGTIPGYNSMGAKLPTAEEAAATTYNITGIVGAYKAKEATEVTYQVLPVKIEDVNGGGGETGEMNIAKFNQLADNSEVTFDGTVTVLAQKGSYLYVKDATGFMLVYGSTGQTYKMGDIIPAGFGGKKVTWDGEPELQSPKDFQAASGTETVTAEELTPAQVNHDNWGKYVILKNVTINVTDKKFKDAAGNEAPYFDRFGVAFPADGTTCDVYAIVGSYGKQTVYQLLPLEFSGATITVPEVDLAGAASQTGKFKLKNPLTAVYQNGKYLFVKDGNTAGLLFADFGELTYRNGDIIPAGIEGTWNASYNEVGPDVATMQPASGNEGEVVPDEWALEELAQDMVNQYVAIPDVSTITKDESDTKGLTYTINDGTQDLTLYNRFNGVTVPTDGKTYKIYGFVNVFRGNIQLYPTKFDDGSGVADINAEKAVKSVKYFNLLGVESAEPFAGMNIVVTTYDDGSKAAKKIVK